MTHIGDSATLIEHMYANNAEKGKVRYHVQTRGSKRYQKYDVWRGSYIGDLFQRIGYGPEGSFNNYSDASQFCSELNQAEKGK
jgi:hypothetical protein